MEKNFMYFKVSAQDFFLGEHYRLQWLHAQGYALFKVHIAKFRPI
jgi:hypothetical protein